MLQGAASSRPQCVTRQSGKRYPTAPRASDRHSLSTSSTCLDRSTTQTSTATRCDPCSQNPSLLLLSTFGQTASTTPGTFRVPYRIGAGTHRATSSSATFESAQSGGPAAASVAKCSAAGFRNQPRLLEIANTAAGDPRTVP